MSSTTPDGESRFGHNFRALVGWLPFLGGVVVGVVGVVVGLNQVGTPAGGLYLLAASVAFGLLANAILRR